MQDMTQLSYFLQLVRKDETAGVVTMQHADDIRDRLRAMTDKELCHLRELWREHKRREIMGQDVIQDGNYRTS